MSGPRHPLSLTDYQAHAIREELREARRVYFMGGVCAGVMLCAAVLVLSMALGAGRARAADPIIPYPSESPIRWYPSESPSESLVPPATMVAVTMPPTDTLP